MRAQKTLLHAIVAAGVLYGVGEFADGAPPLLGFVIEKLTVTPLGPFPAALGFAVGLNNHTAIAIPAYIVLLLVSTGIEAAGGIAAGFGAALLVGYALRGVVNEPAAGVDRTRGQ